MAIFVKCIGENPERKTVEMMWTTDSDDSHPQYMGLGAESAPQMWFANRDYEEFCG